MAHDLAMETARRRDPFAELDPVRPRDQARLLCWRKP